VISYTLGTGCAVTATVTVNPAITVSAISGSTTPACIATGITYNVTNTLGSSYTWTAPSGATITSGSTGPNNNAITVDFGSTNGDITVFETNSSGCVSPTQTLPISLMGCGLNADFTSDVTTICSGGTVNYTNSSTGTSGATTYSWNFGTGASPATATGVGPHAVVYNTTGSKDITLTITEGASDIVVKNSLIQVNPVPTTGPLYRRPNN
jgi:PKD repeat protein